MNLITRWKSTQSVNGGLGNSMKFYLSSYRIPDTDAFNQFVGKSPSTIRIGLILHAKDDRSSEDRQIKQKELTDYFSTRGYQVEVVELLSGDATAALQSKLQTFDVLWFSGGNVYCLRRALRKSGIEVCLGQILQAGVIYAGESAGAILAGPTLNHLK